MLLNLLKTKTNFLKMKYLFTVLAIVLGTSFINAQATTTQKASAVKQSQPVEVKQQEAPREVVVNAQLLVEKGQPNGKLSWKPGVVIITVQGTNILNQKYLIDTKKMKSDKRFRELLADERVYAFTTVNYSEVGN